MTQKSKILKLRKIVSGGQTGVDRAALDVAIYLGIEHGGWCPRGRLAEDGTIPKQYQLVETESTDYANRTEQNVIDSDGTLILFMTKLSGGSLLTYKLARRHHRSCLTVDLNGDLDFEFAKNWLVKNNISVLNVAGPRQSNSRTITALAESYLIELLQPISQTAQ